MYRDELKASQEQVFSLQRQIVALEKKLKKSEEEAMGDKLVGMLRVLSVVFMAVGINVVIYLAICALNSKEAISADYSLQTHYILAIGLGAIDVALGGVVLATKVFD